MRVWLAIPLLLAPVGALADSSLHLGPAAAEGPAVYSDDTVCDHIPGCSLNIARSVQPPGWSWTSSEYSPMIATLGVGGCIVGPFKLFDHGQTFLEIPAGAEYPAGCRKGSAP